MEKMYGKGRITGDSKCSFCGKRIEDTPNMIMAPNRNVFICEKCVDLCKAVFQKTEKEEDKNGDDFGIGLAGMTPRKIKAELDRHVVSQDIAKKILSVAIYNHNKRLNDRTGRIRKSNILIAGPSGCGKTLLAQTLAKMLNVPMAIADATSLTEAGYVGDDVETCIQKLIQAADNDVELAQKGIIFIDEIDKIARKGENRSITRDVSGEGVQQALLKLVEGCTVTVPLNDRRKHPNGNNIQFDTTNVLFICGGAFEGMFDSEEKKTMGFNRVNNSKNTDKDKSANDKLTPDALRKFGMLPELVGRFPVLCAITDLDEEGLMRVLVEPEEAITKEYELLFEQDGVELTFEEDALREIARIAVERKTGARGLRSILESIMLDIMYDIPDDPDITECIITKDTVTTKVPKTVKRKAS